MFASDQPASDGVINCARAEDLPQVMAGLRTLAGDLNDPFDAAPEVLQAALFGPQAHSVCLLARGGDGPRGLALCSPFVSTVLGHACIYVSDLWVAPEARGRSLGRGLLIAAARDGQARWQAQALFLNVYTESTGAIAFYRRLGFEISQRVNRGALSGAAFRTLLEQEYPA